MVAAMLHLRLLTWIVLALPAAPVSASFVRGSVTQLRTSEQRTDSEATMIRKAFASGPNTENAATSLAAPVELDVAQQLALQAQTKKGSLLGPYSPTEHWQNFTVLCITLMLLLFAASFVRTRAGGSWNALYMAAYLILGVGEYLLARSISIQYDGLPFYATVGVVAIDILKLLVTIGLVAWSGSWDCFGKLTSSDAELLTVPVCMYFGLNTLFYLVISTTVLATYAITFELQIIVVAGLGWFVFARTLSRLQALACVGVCVGAAIHHSGQHQNGASWAGIFFPLCMAFWAATSTIVCEYAFKKGRHLDINAQNTYMYTLSIVLGVTASCVIKFYRGVPWTELLVGLHHPKVIVLLALRALFGIACSRILKYMDSLSKTIGSALCAPLALGFAPLAVSEHVTTYTFVAIFITYVASALYWTNPAASVLEQPSKGASEDSQKLKGETS
jgi:drug/metabolite transporter (DMT)-like permease